VGAGSPGLTPRLNNDGSSPLPAGSVRYFATRTSRRTSISAPLARGGGGRGVPRRTKGGIKVLSDNSPPRHPPLSRLSSPCRINVTRRPRPPPNAGGGARRGEGEGRRGGKDKCRNVSGGGGHHHRARYSNDRTSRIKLCSVIIAEHVRRAGRGISYSV
jgi:hypothetical protein